MCCLKNGWQFVGLTCFLASCETLRQSMHICAVRHHLLQTCMTPCCVDLLVCLACCRRPTQVVIEPAMLCTANTFHLTVVACLIRVLSADADSHSMWVGTDTGTVCQLALAARKVDSHLVYTIDILQVLQLAQVSSQPCGLVTAAATLADGVSPFQQQQQHPTPFAQAPRQLTLSSSASSYGGSNAVVESVSNPCYQPSHPSAAAGSSAEGRAPDAPLAASANQHSSGQLLCSQPLLSNQPLLGPANRQISRLPPLGTPFAHGPGRAFSAELMHGAPPQQSGPTPLLSRRSSVRHSGSSSPAESVKQAAGALQMQGSMQRQCPMQRQGSAVSYNSTAPATVGAGIVHAIAVVGGRVITSSGTEPECALAEWSLEGILLTMHPCCELGECLLPVIIVIVISIIIIIVIFFFIILFSLFFIIIFFFCSFFFSSLQQLLLPCCMARQVQTSQANLALLARHSFTICTV